jgi:hypothetical protein
MREVMERVSSKKSQALLDFIIVFSILLIFLAGLTRIWIWFNANFAKRNVDYQTTRFSAGTASDTHLDSLDYQDKTLKIDDDWVFKGKASGKIDMPPVAVTALDVISGEGGDSGTLIICASARRAAESLREQADNMDAQADKMQKIVDLADEWWKPLWFWFKVLGIDVEAYEKAIDALRDGAEGARRSADQIETTACDENARKKAMLELAIEEKKAQIVEQEEEIQSLINAGAPDEEIADARDRLEELNLGLKELLAELAALNNAAKE